MATNRIVAKPIKTFSREEPCTKIHLHNCFFSVGTGAYIPRAIVEARGEIGLNAIKYMRKNGLAQVTEQGSVEYWELTEEGHDWLAKGLARHLELHPEEQSQVVKAGGTVTAPRLRRKVR